MATTKSSLRRRLLVDPKVQGPFLLRIGLYWIGCAATGAVANFVGQRLYSVVGVLNAESREVQTCVPLLSATLCLLPIVVYDALTLTNKLVGPLYRTRGAVRKLAKGEHVAPIRFRDGDFWHEYADEFNALIARIENLERERNTAIGLEQRSELEPSIS